MSSNARPRVDRDRLLRTVTFWLRPEFVLRVLHRFQQMAGFDCAIALASSALTAVIPLAIVIGAIVSKLGGKGTAERIIDRYDLTGGGAEAIRDILAPPAGASVSIGVVGFLFLMLAVLSFTRAVQRLFEQAWELPSLSVRNTLNGLLWIGGFALYAALTGLLNGLIGDEGLGLGIVPAVVTLPFAAAFLLWSGSVLSAGRISRRDLVPFALVAAAALAVYSVGAEFYVPRLFNTYATRYGVIGAVFALISALFCVMVVVVASAAVGREVRDELDRIERGERPAEGEVRRQWDAVTTEARTRWATMRTQVQERRRRRRRGSPPASGD